jgi:ATP-dependent RNA helicase DBP3
MMLTATTMPARAYTRTDEPAGKKAKRQQQQQQQGPSNKQATPQQQRQPLAVVGDVSLATSRPPIVRSLYSPHPAVAALSAAEVAALREERRTTLVGGEDAAPLTSFEQTGLSPQLLHSVRDFTAPSPIQAQCWPVLLSGHDLIGIAATGSGKTLGFGLPMLAHILAQRDSSSAAAGRKGAAAATSYKRAGPGALVLAPTRELALQIAAVLTDAGSKAGVTCTCVYGGVPKGPQVSVLWCGVVWCGVVWCGVVWCGVVWCGVVWCGVVAA